MVANLEANSVREAGATKDNAGSRLAQEAYESGAGGKSIGSQVSAAGKTLTNERDSSDKASGSLPNIEISGEIPNRQFGPIAQNQPDGVKVQNLKQIQAGSELLNNYSGGSDIPTNAPSKSGELLNLNRGDNNAPVGDGQLNGKCPIDRPLYPNSGGGHEGANDWTAGIGGSNSSGAGGDASHSKPYAGSESGGSSSSSGGGDLGGIKGDGSGSSKPCPSHFDWSRIGPRRPILGGYNPTPFLPNLQLTGHQAPLDSGFDVTGKAPLRTTVLRERFVR